MALTEDQGLPTAILSAPPQSPPRRGHRCLGDKAGASPPSPVGALRCGALQRQGLPSSSGLEPLRAAEAACRVLWAHCSDPRRGEQHTILLLQTRPALRDQCLPCMAGLHTLSGEHTWMQHARCPQFPELMSQFSFSISTRFLKASFCYNL